MSYQVLVSEDDATTRYLLELYCKSEPYDLAFAADGVEAMRLFGASKFDILVTDVRLPGVDGEGLLAFVRDTRPEVPVIVMTGFGTIDGAVNFLRRGAFDYITKPFTREQFLHRLSLAARNIDLTQEVDRLRRMQRLEALSAIVTTDNQLAKILSQLPSVAKTDASVVVYGESGTGKELFARAVHALSTRSDKPFVSVSCAALPETLIESELFGHMRGSFTDAHADRPGLIEEAEGGTLFLDEVGELTTSVQVKLLRFLQEREFKPIGSNTMRHADVRIVAATNRSLEKAVTDGSFREDLYYRLNVIPIHLPPLRERAGDVALLANHFLRRFAHEYGRPVRGFSQPVLQTMATYPWPGNVRELINRVQRMVVLSEDNLITPEQWQRSGSQGLTGIDSAEIALEHGFATEKRRAVERFEAAYITECLRQSEGNVAQAARLARIDRKNFWMLAKRCRIDPDKYRSKNDSAKPPSTPTAS